MQEQPGPEQGPEHDQNAITPVEIIQNLAKLKDEFGVDFEDEDVEHIESLDPEEVVDYLFVALFEAGVEDPEAVMQTLGLTE